jgi:hypothetical protein
MHRYILTIHDPTVLDRLKHLPTRFSSIKEAKESAEKIAKDLNVTVTVAEILGQYRPCVNWEDAPHIPIPIKDERSLASTPR